jgi:hypothetical protein
MSEKMMALTRTRRTLFFMRFSIGREAKHKLDDSIDS